MGMPIGSATQRPFAELLGLSLHCICPAPLPLLQTPAAASWWAPLTELLLALLLHCSPSPLTFCALKYLLLQTRAAT